MHGLHTPRNGRYSIKIAIADGSASSPLDSRNRQRGPSRVLADNRYFRRKVLPGCSLPATAPKTESLPTNTSGPAYAGPPQTKQT